MGEKNYIDGLVSVITPVYRSERFLEQALQSVFSQSYPSIEPVLVDDRSPDHSGEIIQRLTKGHPEIIYWLQEKNMGAAVARNQALDLARGQYVAFLDSDDLWLPEKTEKQIELMKRTGSPFSYTAIDMIDESGKTIKGKRNIREECDYRFLLHNTMIATSTVIIDRRILGEFQMPLRRGGQDYATWLKLLRGGCIARGINEALAHYRISSGSLSSNKWNSLKQVWEIQTKDEGIRKVPAAAHVCCFALNAIKKYFF